ncbi:hypothetical protein AVEN_53698-1 [Araneus ventricosus]|uniref:F-box domain-containing protein n=1 Tax=Araneus ventricosus TaxID=182803 RepID=A0A4Y2UQC6_ARAVE|nr:hypothetical protein AVEN_53698-1 [Araneus ventricosus]
MSEVSLYKICLRRVYVLVKAGTWNSYSINPFLNLPSGIIDDLMASSESSYPKTSEVLLLLTSGSLTRLHLGSFRFQKESDLFLNVIRTNCFRSLRVLTCHSRDNENTPLIETLIRSCSKLEEFHSSKLVNFEVFLNCKELRVLIFSLYPLSCDFVDSPMNLAVLASLRNLQVFFTSFMVSNVTAEVLKHCPQLVSVGHNDSLNALEKIHANSKRKCGTNYTEISNHFQLKRCVWGKHTQNLNPETVDIISYKSKFPEKIRKAISLCPFVEDLIIYVHHTDSIESLKNLKQLTRLKISFHECDDDYMTNFLALLKVIGPKLKYLSVDATHPVPIDIICEYCPRLESLELARFATISRPNRPHCNIFMKNLRVMKIDQNALLFLLSSCKNLVELFLCDAMCLDDNLLSQILRLNPLAELKICDIAESSLTKRGFRMFLERVASLQRVNFASFRRDVASICENLITELNLTDVIYGEMFDIPYGGFSFITPFFHF